VYIIFLDIDGVLNTEHGLKFWSKDWKKPKLMRNSKDDKKQFCPEAVEVLRKVIEATGAKIVISSTWRAEGLEWFQEFWKDRGLPGEIIDITGYDQERVRGVDVNIWLRSKGWYYPTSYWTAPYNQEDRDNCEIEGYCIVDDDWDFFIQQTRHYVNVPAKYGLAAEGKYEEVIKALNAKPD
jgi:hypothetical protein